MMNHTLAQLPGVVVGVVAGATSRGGPVVSWTDAVKPRKAGTVWMERRPDWSASRGLRVLLGFVGGETSEPVVLGFLDPPVLVESPAEPRADEPAGVPDALRIESRRELVIECGEARIALEADGRITVHGGYLVSRSRGVNKIQGASVKIN